MKRSSFRHYCCEKCGENFTRLYLLKQHLMVFHKDIKYYTTPFGEKKIVCLYCNKRFMKVGFLQRHFAIVHVIRKKKIN